MSFDVKCLILLTINNTLKSKPKYLHIRKFCSFHVAAMPLNSYFASYLDDFVCVKESNSTKCSSAGNYTCGVCVCEPGR